MNHGDVQSRMNPGNSRISQVIQHSSDQEAGVNVYRERDGAQERRPIRGEGGSRVLRRGRGSGGGGKAAHTRRRRLRRQGGSYAEEEARVCRERRGSGGGGKAAHTRRRRLGRQGGSYAEKRLTCAEKSTEALRRGPRRLNVCWEETHALRREIVKHTRAHTRTHSKQTHAKKRSERGTH